jgi:hypothetical protein
MSSIIQKNSAFATVTGSGSVSVALNPLAAGSVIVLVAGLVETNGGGASIFSSGSFKDQLNNSYSANPLSSGSNGPFAWTVYAVISPANGAETYTFNFTGGAGTAAYTFLAGIAAYELSGATAAANDTGSSTSSVNIPVGSVTASLAGLNEGSFGNFIVSVGAFLDSSLVEAQGFGAGSGWTLDGSDAVAGAFDAMAILFQSQLTTGNPTGVFSGSANSDELDGSVGILAVLLTSAIGSGGTGGNGGGGTGGNRNYANGVAEPATGVPSIYTTTQAAVMAAAGITGDNTGVAPSLVNIVMVKTGTPVSVEWQIALDRVMNGDARLA